MSSRPELKLNWCSRVAAKYAVEHWHYSKSLPAGKSVKIGVWEDDKFIGCVLFGMGANNVLSRPYGLTMHECCELTRVALSGHKTPVTRIISIAIRMLKQQSPGLRLIVSFADPNHGHIGGVYQGGGWIYSGRSGEHKEFIYKGKQIHHRTANSLGLHKNGILKTLPVIVASSKYRYLMPLDDAMRKQIEPLRKPYPKRAGSITADAAVIHTAEGGAAPTPALSELT